MKAPQRCSSNCEHHITVCFLSAVPGMDLFFPKTKSSTVLNQRDEKHRLVAESRNGIPGTGTALGSSINSQMLALFCAWWCHFFHHPKEIPRGEMSIPIVFSMSKSYFLSLHI